MPTWETENKQVRHAILSILSNELFYVYCQYKVAKEIWDAINKKYMLKDAGTQKYAMRNFRNLQMIEDRDVSSQIHDYHLLINDFTIEDIKLLEPCVAGYLVFMGDSRSTPMIDKGKVLLKLTSRKVLVLSDVLYVLDIQWNLVLVSLLGKAGMRILFDSDKIVLTKNDAFVGKGYCN